MKCIKAWKNNWSWMKPFAWLTISLIEHVRKNMFYFDKWTGHQNMNQSMKKGPLMQLVLKFIHPVFRSCKRVKKIMQKEKVVFLRMIKVRSFGVNNSPSSHWKFHSKTRNIISMASPPPLAHNAKLSLFQLTSHIWERTEDRIATTVLGCLFTRSTGIR